MSSFKRSTRGIADESTEYRVHSMVSSCYYF
jgi:hypothetical protein